MEFLNFLIQPKNGLGLDFHKVERLDGRTGWELAGRAGHKDRNLPKPQQWGCRWIKQLVNCTQGISED